MAEDSGAALARLVELINDYEERRIDENALRARVAADTGLRELLRQQAGSHMVQGGKQIDFGMQNQIGQVQVRDVAGGDIIHLTINLAAPVTPAAPTPLDADEIAHQRALIAQHRKTLNALELQAAKFGIYTPPHITIEIDDLTRKIAALRRELGE